MKKIVLSLLAFGVFDSAFALDSGAQNLTAMAGATDYFKITCAGETNYLNFKLLENAVNAVAEKPIELIGTDDKEPEVILPQILNAKLTKLKLSATVSKIAASSMKEISLKGGNGSYSLKLDTIDTNLNLKNPQAYSIQYQCLNATNKITTGASTVTGSLINGKTKAYTIKCSNSKKTGDTSSLKITITNKTAITKMSTLAQIIETPASGNLTAQLLTNRRDGSIALNTTGDVLNMKSGNGDYFLMVDSPINAAKNYRFQYSCLTANDVEAKTSLIQILQDQ